LEAFDKPALPAPAGYPYVTEAVSPWWRIVEQLQATGPHVEGFTTWEWHKYGSGQPSRRIELTSHIVVHPALPAPRAREGKVDEVALECS
jgi:hypothetical protein